MNVAIINLKGGVGKTLVTLHLANEAHARGVRTLVADADMQRSALTWGDVAAERGHAGPPVIGTSAAMARQLPDLARGYELVVIDTPPHADQLTRAALFVADLVVVPTLPGPTDFWSMSTTIDLVLAAQALRPSLRAFLLLNQMEEGQVLSREARGVLTGTGLPVLNATLGRRIGFGRALGAGMTLTRYAPRSEGAREVRALCDEVLS